MIRTQVELYLHLHEQHPEYLEQMKQLSARQERERGEQRLQHLSEARALAVQYEDTHMIELIDRSIPGTVAEMRANITSLTESMGKSE